MAALRSRASSYYTGPQEYAIAFQIPLMQRGIEGWHFSNQNHSLDPESAYYWLTFAQLYPDAFAKAPVNPHIHTIHLDFVNTMTDPFLLLFLSKFPSPLNELNLLGCPITEKAFAKGENEWDQKTLERSKVLNMNGTLINAEGYGALKEVVPSLNLIADDFYDEPAIRARYILTRDNVLTQYREAIKTHDKPQIRVCRMWMEMFARDLLEQNPDLDKLSFSPIDPALTDFTITMKGKDFSKDFPIHSELWKNRSPYYYRAFTKGGDCYGMEAQLLEADSQMTPEFFTQFNRYVYTNQMELDVGKSMDIFWVVKDLFQFEGLSDRCETVIENYINRPEGEKTPLEGVIAMYIILSQFPAGFKKNKELLDHCMTLAEKYIKKTGKDQPPLKDIIAMHIILKQYPTIMKKAQELLTYCTTVILSKGQDDLAPFENAWKKHPLSKLDDTKRPAWNTLTTIWKQLPALCQKTLEGKL